MHLIVDCSAADLFEEFNAAGLWRCGILETFIAIRTDRPKVFGSVRAAFRQASQLVARTMISDVSEGASECPKNLLVLYPHRESMPVRVRAG
jgi:hypothetical protein